MTSWLDMFRDTITCSHCKEHFSKMLQSYRMRYPNMLHSRQDFAMFAFRAHNVVNARLHKPVYGTLAECMEVLRNNIKTRTPREYRVSYLNHITNYWKTIQDVSGIVALKKINEMKKIETNYFASKDTNFDVVLKDDIVVIPRNWVENVSEAPAVSGRPVQLGANTSARAGFKIVGGRMMLR